MQVGDCVGVDVDIGMIAMQELLIVQLLTDLLHQFVMLANELANVG